MLDFELHSRAIGSKDWATVLFVFSFILIAVARTVFENRFIDFAKLAYSDKYIKIYRDSGNLMNWFTIALLLFN